MKKTIDEKTGRKIVIFNKYELKGSEICPECGRRLDDNDKQLLQEIGKRNCKKCGAILIK